MRIRSLAAIAAIGLLGGVAQVDAHGGGLHGGGAMHGGAPRPAAAPAAQGLANARPSYAAVPADRPEGGGVQHGFQQDAGFGRDGDFRRDRDRTGAPGLRIGFPGGVISFAPRPPSRRVPVLYNYYYGVGDSYYSNAPSDYAAPANTCPGWRWDASSQTRVWTADCQD